MVDPILFVKADSVHSGTEPKLWLLFQVEAADMRLLDLENWVDSIF